MSKKRIASRTSFVVALSLWLMALAASVATAQTPKTRPSDAPPARAATPSDESADLSITAHVTARELRFEKVPNPRVEFSGRPRRDTVWEAQRENLPQEVRPGVTYRDIGIRLRITSVFADIDRIVAEALGEVPATDDTPPRQQQQPEARPQPVTPPETNSIKPPRTDALRKGRGN